jgi:hypothetical protein
LDDHNEDLSAYHLNLENHVQRVVDKRPGFIKAIPKSTTSIKATKGGRKLLKHVQQQSLGITGSSKPTHQSQSGSKDNESEEESNHESEEESNHESEEESDDDDAGSKGKKRSKKDSNRGRDKRRKSNSG